MLPQLSQAQGGMAQLWHMLPAFSHWREQLSLCEQGRELIDAETRVPMTLNTAITLLQLNYQHQQSEQSVNVAELSIPAKMTTAIVGPSGSGKTTLLDIISGLNPPASGRILIDGKPLLGANISWRQGVAYIPQETIVLDGTIRDNLTWGNADISEDELWQALEKAAATTFTRNLPKQLDTIVGERGVRLSGGERQRLALARALLRKPQLLILDEATSALDTDNQRTIFQAIRQLHGQLTVIIVTHRYEELGDLVDGCIEVNQGKVSTWQAKR
jgi:ATP-binding cassette subfamily C protein